MPTEKIADLPTPPSCRHPEHNPPTLQLFEPGIYKHTCPGCGGSQHFVIPERPSL